MKKILPILGSVLGVAGTVLSAVTLGYAIRFGELGRVVLYAVTALICLELAVLSILKLIKMLKK